MARRIGLFAGATAAVTAVLWLANTDGPPGFSSAATGDLSAGEAAPGDARGWLAAGKAKFAAGEYAAARVAFRKALRDERDLTGPETRELTALLGRMDAVVAAGGADRAAAARGTATLYLSEARAAAARGDVGSARKLARAAAAFPVQWSVGRRQPRSPAGRTGPRDRRAARPAAGRVRRLGLRRGRRPRRRAAGRPTPGRRHGRTNRQPVRRRRVAGRGRIERRFGRRLEIGRRRPAGAGPRGP